LLCTAAVNRSAKKCHESTAAEPPLRLQDLQPQALIPSDVGSCETGVVQQGRVRPRVHKTSEDIATEAAAPRRGVVAKGVQRCVAFNIPRIRVGTMVGQQLDERRAAATDGIVHGALTEVSELVALHGICASTMLKQQLRHRISRIALCRTRLRRKMNGPEAPAMLIDDAVQLAEQEGQGPRALAPHRLMEKVRAGTPMPAHQRRLKYWH
jgi:hypothetical protein